MPHHTLIKSLNMKKIVISTGAGVSAESGMPTYRDAGGLWENYPVMEVASDEGFERNPALIHKFYSDLRTKLAGSIEPNDAHRSIAALEKLYDVTVITQNVDDLHERGGSSHVIHLHGELMKVRSMRHPERIYRLPCNSLTSKGLITDVNTRDSYGDAVRPHIVFFGEAVPEFEHAVAVAMQADIFVIIGTSLAVYPAASLLAYVPAEAQVYYIDPRPVAVPARVKVIAKTATQGMKELTELLKSQS